MSVQSVADLTELKEQALAERQARAAIARAQVSVGMGTCGIAAGARETANALLDAIKEAQIDRVIVSTTGCIGRCEFEPIVNVQVEGTPPVTYGRVTPERARAIIAEHVVGGKPIREWQVTNG